jgi:hypothetical protein
MRQEAICLICKQTGYKWRSYEFFTKGFLSAFTDWPAGKMGLTCAE